MKEGIVMQEKMNAAELEYVGFWPRVGAAMIDSLLLLVVSVPLVTWVYGTAYWSSDALIQGPADILITWVLPAIAIILFWVYRQATPGKFAISARIVDAVTGEKPSTGQLIGRYAGYYVAMLPFMIGILWVAFDPRKQGWHDKLAGTVVVRTRNRGPQPVHFDGGGSSQGDVRR
jgi:uncharacterized RDD family membrane protein YckC